MEIICHCRMLTLMIIMIKISKKESSLIRIISKRQKDQNLNFHKALKIK